MSNLVIMHDQQAVTTSLQVAETFDKNHKDVLKAIDNKLQSAQNCADYRNMFASGNYTDSRGREQKLYYMNRDGFSFIAFGFTGQKADDFKLDYINAFNTAEQLAKQKLPQTPEEQLQLTMQVANRTVKRVGKLESDVADIKDNQPVTPGEYNYISRRVNKTVMNWINVHELHLDNKQRSPFFRDLNRGLAEYLGFKTRSQMRHKDFDKADEFITNWQPSTSVILTANSEQGEPLEV